MSKEKDKDKKNTSLRLERKTLKALKLKAVENDLSIQTILEQLVEMYLDDKIQIKSSK